MTDQNTTLSQIEAIKEATLNGKIPWVRANPTTFQWTRMLASRGMVIVTTLQKVQGRPQIPGHPAPEAFFLLVRNQANEAFLSLNTQINTGYDVPLRALFQAAEKSSEAKGADILAELLKE